MFVFRTIPDLQAYLEHCKSEHRPIGFVPTMGALHQGHLSLVDTCIGHVDCCVVSIFVNPKQFNSPDDLEKYPTDLESDLALLFSAGCHVVFIPDADSIYDTGSDAAVGVDFHDLDKRMEGEFRPGHFKGVAQVMKRLLEIVAPDKLFMGQKDFQQVAILRFMIKALCLNIDLMICPTVREPHGLAMSSRNTRLSPSMRQSAAVIYQTLTGLKHMLHDRTIPQLRNWALKALAIPGFRPEYLEIVDGDTLLSVAIAADSDFIVACCSVWADDVRLIDNMILKQANKDSSEEE